MSYHLLVSTPKSEKSSLRTEVIGEVMKSVVYRIRPLADHLTSFV